MIWFYFFLIILIILWWSFVCWEGGREFGMVFTFLFPSCSHSLPLSKEFHSIFTIKISISCEWFLVSCERKHRKWDGNWYIDAYLPAFNFILEFISCWAWSSEDGTSVTPCVIVDEVNGLLEGVYSHTNENWTENLFFVNSHIRSDIIDNSWSYKVTLRIFGMNVFTTVKYHLSALFLGCSDQIHNPLL